MIDDDLRAHVSRRTRQVRENVCQLTEPQLGGSTTAARVLREANGGLGFGRHAAQRIIRTEAARDSPYLPMWLGDPSLRSPSASTISSRNRSSERFAASACVVPWSGTISRLIARSLAATIDLYRAAQQLPIEAFAADAFGWIRTRLPFDRGVMVTTVARDPAWIDAHFCDVPDPRALMESHARVRHLDRGAPLLLQNPLRAFRLDIDGEEAAGPELAPYRDHLERHAGHSTLGICASTDSDEMRSVLMVVRGSLERRFTVAELQLFEAIGPHVIEAAAVCRGRALPRDEALPVALLGRDGRLLQTTPSFVRLLWPDKSPESAFLPDPVLRAVRAGRAFALAGGKHSMHAYPEPFGGHLLRIRTSSPVDRLTSRERQIAAMFARGLSHKAIAETLELAPATVRNHLQKLYVKLEISTRAELVELLQRP